MTTNTEKYQPKVGDRVVFTREPGDSFETTVTQLDPELRLVRLDGHGWTHYAWVKPA